MKPEVVLAWVMGEADGGRLSAVPPGSLPFRVEVAREPSPEAMLERLSRESHDVLCVEDAPPFDRTRTLLRLTDTLPMRPVLITVAPSIGVPAAVELMESGVFSIVSEIEDTRRLVSAVNRALENRRAFQKILEMSRSLQRSRTFLEKKSVALTAERVKLRRKASEVSLMRRVAERLGRARTLEEGLAEVLSPLSSFLGVARGVFLVTPGKGRWVVSATGGSPAGASGFPRAADRFRRAAPVAVTSEGTLAVAPPPGAAEPGIALPVRIKRRFLGYGVFWGGEPPDASPGTLRLLEAVGVQVGAFCENIALHEQVATERDRLAHAKEEIDLLFRLASVLNEDPDLDDVFRWLCRELGRFVPYSGIEFLSLLGRIELRTAGTEGMLDSRGRATPALTHRWRRYLPDGGAAEAAGRIAVKEFPYGDPGDDDGADGRRWISPLAFSDRTLGAFAVRLARAGTADAGARERVLRAVTAQLSLFLHNFAEREKVRVLASHDGLTGLYNYRSFQERFEREFEWFLRRGRNLALLMIDLDHFKGINDTFGHQAGDRVLKGVAGILQENLRKTDYAFRYGGDEFVVLMPDAGIRNAEVFARRVRDAVRARMHDLAPDAFRVSLSIGIADCTVLSSREPEELLKRADGALYQAKAKGRDRVRVAERPEGAGAGKEG